MSEIDLDEASLRDLVMVNDGQVVTTSLKVAERFGKCGFRSTVTGRFG
ncbi:hypothetical protein [Pseudomonas aeruginosa]|nr:hypothetical protein [Pseudomonas aeruginosa]